MKKQLLSFVTTILFAGTVSAGTPGVPVGFKAQKGPGISFTENKGQVHDQYDQPRPDVLYGAMSGDMALHIRKAGISYQLYRIDRYREVKDPTMREARREADQQSVYRIDLNWLNYNTDFTRSEDGILPGYSNYYLQSCPDGALNVRSYKSITLHDLYNGIDLHYYEKNGDLKHDYIVAAHADYRQIQIQVEGAGISLNEDGSLVFTTPLGKVQEAAPVVFQKGRQLKAKWQVENNTLSFEVENYDPGHELIIDPITRIWGTYYGGGASDLANSCATDPNGYVYLAGYTNATAGGTVIATTGAHQAATGGNNDAFLAKFNGSGVRQWATYYGGTGDDRANSCAADALGNVYLVGVTNTNTGSNPIATSGSHQPAFGAVFNSTSDAFLVKFIANGSRQWGTYYGGSGDDSAMSCALDASGNIYFAGWAESQFSIATGSGHQPVFGGGVYDAFLAKFNASGLRLWATFYGNPANDVGFGCNTDVSGNVYLTGSTYSAAAIATPGSHQTALGGGTDAFLVKFDASGTRQWGTFYGGTGNDNGVSCATDGSGNVFMAGETVSNTSTAVATGGAHQPAYGGVSDAYLVKFNTNGVRQWGTYYGGMGGDYGTFCAADASGNVYLTGSSFSGVGTAIGTPGSHQPVYGGGSEAFLVKFDAGGARLSGTFYGGPGSEGATSCAADASGNVYMAGLASTGTGTLIATAGSHQDVFGGGNFYDGFLVKMDVCDVAPAQPSAISGPTIACAGAATSYSTPLVAGASSYTWSAPGLLPVSGGNTISVALGASGVFTLIAGNACGVSPQRTLQVTVSPSPIITVNSGSICSGNAFTITATGAVTYTYSGGPVVSPNSTTSYTVAGTDASGCSNTAVSSVTVIPSPTVSVNSGAICAGQSFTIVASGAASYTYSGGGPVVSPAVSSAYSVSATNSQGCSHTAVSNVTVNPLPTVSVSTTDAILCIGESATLTAGGASAYTFNPGGTGASSIISPTITSTYSVTGADANGCRNDAAITQSVDACAGLPAESPGQTSGLRIYPNPVRSIAQLELSAAHELIIVNAIGQTVYSAHFSPGSHQIDLEHLAKGVYILKAYGLANSVSLKLVKE